MSDDGPRAIFSPGQVGLTLATRLVALGRTARAVAQHQPATLQSGPDAAVVGDPLPIDAPPAPRDPRIDFSRLVGLAAVVFSAVYLVSDLIEVAQGDFSTVRLSLTYVGEAAIPLFVLGLYAVQRVDDRARRSPAGRRPRLRTGDL